MNPASESYLGGLEKFPCLRGWMPASGPVRRALTGREDDRGTAGLEAPAREAEVPGRDPRDPLDGLLGRFDVFSRAPLADKGQAKAVGRKREMTVRVAAELDQPVVSERPGESRVGQRGQ